MLIRTRLLETEIVDYKLCLFDVSISIFYLFLANNTVVRDLKLIFTRVGIVCVCIVTILSSSSSIYEKQDLVFF